MRRWLSNFALGLLSGGLILVALLYSGAVSEGVMAGLSLCGRVIIPSLYLFMVLSAFVCESRAGVVLSAPLTPLVRYLFRLPPAMGSALAMSYLGGYPVGARAIAGLLTRGVITKAEAGRGMRFCCNASPGFVVVAVGVVLVGSRRVGVVLLCCHIAASLLIGVLSGVGKPLPKKRGSLPLKASSSNDATTSKGTASLKEGLPPLEALLGAVNSATTGILSICSYVVLFCALRQVLEDSGASDRLAAALSAFLPVQVQGDTLSALLTGLLEVSAGCAAAAALPADVALVLLPFFLSFGGLSIAFQAASFFREGGFKMGSFLLWRGVHGVITVVLTLQFLSPVDLSTAVAAVFDVPVPYTTPNTPLITLLLLLTLGVLLLRVSKMPQEKREF